MTTNKLCKVTLRGMRDRSSVVIYGESYVVAKNSHDAYKLVLEALTIDNIGFKYERELSTVELIAEETRYPDCRVRLYTYTYGDEDEKCLSTY